MTVSAKEEQATYQLIGPSDSGEISDLLTGLSGKDARRRLQALITEWLRMENLAVLAGAGTSVSSGGKTISVLEREVLETVKQTTVYPKDVSKDNVLKIIEARQAEGAASAFEEWLSFLVNACHLADAPTSPFSGVTWKGAVNPSPSDLFWLIDRISKAIFAECALSSEASSAGSNGTSHFAFLAKLVARDSNLGRAHLFTLNYDTLFEQALELLGIQYFDGFTGRADARFDPSVYGLDVYYPGEIAEGRVRRFDKFIHLYKLHGSIHWQLVNGELRARHPDLSPFADYRSLASTEKAKRLGDLAGHVPSVGILPTANKFAQTLSMPFAHLFRSFQIRLNTPQTFLLVLGYGFGDEHVTRIIETALMNPSLVMLVVEPNPRSATLDRIRRYKDLGRRAFVLTATEATFDAAKFKQATFDDFSQTIMPDVQWLDDFLRLRRFEKQIAAGQGDEESKGTEP